MKFGHFLSEIASIIDIYTWNLTSDVSCCLGGMVAPRHERSWAHGHQMARVVFIITHFIVPPPRNYVQFNQFILDISTCSKYKRKSQESPDLSYVTLLHHRYTYFILKVTGKTCLFINFKQVHGDSYLTGSTTVKADCLKAIHFN